MASNFPEVQPGQVGLYVGTIASSFALAQFATNFFWGWLSDRIGRKPVILIGTILTAIAFVLFGLCRTLWQAVLVQVFMGLVNGNQGVVSTCLGEITDRSNQSKAFTYLPVIYGLGGITGPVVGGLLISTKKNADGTLTSKYPYLAPNLLSAAVLTVDLIVTMIFLEESLEEAKGLPPLGKRVRNLFTWAWQSASSSRPSYLRFHRKSRPLLSGDAPADDSEEEDSNSDSASQASLPTLLPHHTTDLTRDQIFNRDTILLLSTYLIFQLSNISYNSLYPIFAQAAPPTGRDLSPEEIGLSLAFAGVVTIIFQVGIFGKLREKMGNKATYRVGLGGFVVAFFLMPWVGYKDIKGKSVSSGKVWLWVELGFVLLIKTVAAVGGLTSALLLVSSHLDM
jgi:MFS family permease